MPRLVILATLLLAACSTEPPTPLDVTDGTLRAGASAVVITPVKFETFVDANHDGKFNPHDGDTFDDCGRDRVCPGDTGYSGPDADGSEGNGKLDGVWIAGFHMGRPASGVHDHLYVRCLVVTYDGSYFVSLVYDVVGLMQDRIEMIKDRLEALGYQRERVLVTATHNHEGPDTMGLWGPNIGETGVDKAYMDFLVDAGVGAVLEAVSNLRTVTLKLGQVRLRDTDPYSTGIHFGGRNEKNPYLVGTINDLRDPIIVNDLVTVMQYTADNGATVATLFNFSAHPEAVGSSNTLLSADYVGYARDRVEKEFGGVAIFAPSTVGGMMTHLGAAVPLVDEDGNHVYEACTETDAQQGLFGCTETGVPRRDAFGDKVPVLIEDADEGPAMFDFTRSVGYIVGEAAIAAIRNGETCEVKNLKVRTTEVDIPLDNPIFDLALTAGLFESSEDVLVPGPECGHFGCMKNVMTYITIGNSAEILTVPGELFPELALGLPEDPAFTSSRPNVYFRQHKADDPYRIHADPYTLESPVLFDVMKTNYRFIFGLTHSELGYILPAADFLDFADQGDHYEEVNSTGPLAAERVLSAARALTSE